jgi:hypothetical protein
MVPEVAAFAQVAAIIIVLTGSLTTIGVFAARFIMRAQRNMLPPSPVADARLEQLQQSVDAIALEVERIAEAQRFSVKLLSERAESSPLKR